MKNKSCLTFIALTSAMINLSCNENNRDNRQSNNIMLSGYWIPKEIKWHSPKTGIKEIDANTNIADFWIICFDGSGRCDLINSTQTKLKASDSIGVEYEPGMELWKGVYRCLDSNCNNINVNFTPIPDENGRYFHGDKDVNDTLKLILRSDKAFLLFTNKNYVKTLMYDSFSRHKIELLRRVKY